MGNYSIIVSTFLRPGKLRQCLRSITAIPDMDAPNRIIVADDGQEDQQKNKIYKNYRSKLNLTVIDLPYDVGLSKKRNEGLERIDDEFVLFLDDDQYVPSDIYELTTILDKNRQLGGIAPFWVEDGLIKSNAADFFIEHGWALKRGGHSECEQTGTGHSMFRYDHISNAAMFRTAVFDDYGWDEFYTIGEEDTDFYLKHREIDKWDFAVTPGYIIRHDPGAGTGKKYDDERNDTMKLNQSVSHLCEKFGLKGVIHQSSHHHPQRPPFGRLLHWVAINIVPNSILWEVRRREVGFYIVDRVLPNQ